MSLKLSLKANERLIIGGAVIRNGGARCELVVENNVPILREKDILREQDADTVCKKIYFIIQLMYIDAKNLVEHHRAYWEFVREVVKAAPSTLGLIDQISDNILNGKHYQALKHAQKLIEYEQEAIEHARGSVGSVQNGSKDHDVRQGAGSVCAQQGRAPVAAVPE
ncbi:MAG TPA: flagellar biosynthesis repressor FlbT [Nitrospirota bacterium]|nr:flagellar biosynthesis repressor FlbT [Nitrospirota bacterium]